MSNILDIYKVYSLEKIAALNKQSLAMQYEQCGQIIALQKQISASNSTSREILKNQIKELERQEKVRYYKNLIFNLSELSEKLEQIDDSAFYYYICSTLLTPMGYFSKECVNGLEDLQDKEYAKKVCQKIGEMQKILPSMKEEFISSNWHNYDELKTKKESHDITKRINELERDQRQIEKEIEEIQQELNGILSFFMSSSKKERCVKTISTKKNSLLNIRDEIQTLNEESTCIARLYNDAYQMVTSSRPCWEKELDEITQYLPKQSSPKQKIDPLFEKAANVIVKAQIGSTALIQRKFSLGYHRAGTIMDQLEMYGIVGKASGSKPREVLITDASSLQTLLSQLD